jgi:hypothetical protein
VRGAQRWLLELDFPESRGVAAQTLRWASDVVEVGTVLGESYRYEAGLVGPTAAQLEDQIVVEVVDPSIDWPRRFRDVLGSRSRLLLWEEDTVYESAVVFANGTALLPAYGVRSEPVSWEILPDDTSVGGMGEMVPGPLRKVSDATWPTTVPAGSLRVPEESEGVSYPELFGYPGAISDEDAIPVMPVVFGQHSGTIPANSPLILAMGPITATEVLVRNSEAEDPVNEWNDVSLMEDLRGHPVSVATFTFETLTFPPDGAPMMVGFAPATGGGALRSAYDVILYLLEKYGSRTAIDKRRLPEVRDLLAPYMVDTWIDDPMPVWEWIDYLVEYLPVEIATSTFGRYFVPRIFRHDRRRVIDRLVVGEGVERDGLVEVGDESGVLNAQVPSGFHGRVILTGTRDGDPRTEVSQACKKSQARYDKRPDPDVIELDWTSDRTTAALVAEWMADQHAIPERRVTLRCEGRHDRQEGDQIELVDEELGIDGLALIDEPPEVDETGVSIVVRISDDA